jgi:dTDP-4-amino-4,6-dideoxygalactose transaminase
MLLPRFPRRLPFPFDQPQLQYFYYGRNAIYALAQAMNLAGEEILFPAYFEGVELAALLSAGVRIRFYPVHLGMQVDPEEVISCIGPRTRAIYLIHYVGFPGPVDFLSRACCERDLLLVEDCALSLFSRFGERPLGEWGNAAIFSIHKTLPVPNGGALLIRGDHALQIPARTPPPLPSTLAYSTSLLSLYLEMQGTQWMRAAWKGLKALGKSTARALGSEQIPLEAQEFDRARANLGMSRLSRWIIAAQDFRAVVERRRRNYLLLHKRLSHLAAPVFTNLPEGVCPLFYPFQTTQKELVVAQLQARGIGAVDFWNPHHPALGKEVSPEVDQLRREVLQLPCHQDLGPEVMEWMSDQLHQVLRT